MTTSWPTKLAVTGQGAGHAPTGEVAGGDAQRAALTINGHVRGHVGIGQGI